MMRISEPMGRSVSDASIPYRFRRPSKGEPSRAVRLLNGDLSYLEFHEMHPWTREMMFRAASRLRPDSDDWDVTCAYILADADWRLDLLLRRTKAKIAEITEETRRIMS